MIAKAPKTPPTALPTVHRFERALAEDDAAIRALLRRHPMPGRVRVTLEREPSFGLGSAVDGERTHVFVLREPETGRVLGMAQRSVSSAWIDGRPQLVGYLSHMRRDEDRPLARGVAAAGFAACEASRCADELPFDVTSILAENTRARRLLESGLPGLPTYEHLCRYRTFAIDVRAARKLSPARSRGTQSLEIRRAVDADAPAIASFLQRRLSHHAFAPVWTEADLLSPIRSRGLTLDRFFLALRSGKLVGCSALWDQRAFKQVVLHGYTLGVPLVRMLLAPVLRRLTTWRLPAIGSALRMAFLSHAAVDAEDPEALFALVRAVARAPECKELDLLLVGFAAAHPLAAVIQAEIRPRAVESLLYTVHPAGTQHIDVHAGPGVPHFEAARL